MNEVKKISDRIKEVDSEIKELLEEIDKKLKNEFSSYIPGNEKE